MAQPGGKISQTPVTSAKGLGHTGEQKSGPRGPPACSRGPSSPSAFPPPSPTREDNQTLPSLPGGWVVGEIMILSCSLPLGTQVLEKNQVSLGFSPCSLHIPCRDKFSQPSSSSRARMLAFCPPSPCHSISLQPRAENVDFGMQSQPLPCPHGPPSRPCPVPQSPLLSHLRPQAKAKFSSDGTQSTTCRMAPAATESSEAGQFRVKSRTLGPSVCVDQANDLSSVSSSTKRVSGASFLRVPEVRIVRVVHSFLPCTWWVRTCGRSTLSLRPT